MSSKILTTIALVFFFQFSMVGQNILKGIIKDAETKEPLAFATIQYAKDEGVISNEHGAFSIPWEPRITTLRISYVGYKTIDFPVSRTDERIEILVTKTSTTISEIVVKAKDLSASSLLFKSVKKTRRDVNKKQSSKLFRRTYSYRNNIPSEFIEAFYNAEIRDGGVDFFHLKNGRFGVPNQGYFINTQITDLLTWHKLFTREFNYLPGSPLDYKSLKKLRKDFDIQIRKKYEVEQDTIFEIHFEPLQKKNILFSGKVWIKNSNLKIEKVLLQIKDTSRNPFTTIVAPDRNKIDRFDLKFNIGFKEYNGKTVFDYLQMEEEKTIVTPVTSYLVKTNTKFLFYDYGKPFQLPFFSEFADAYNDYEKVLFFPYDEVFWKRNFLIEETTKEAKFRKELEKKQLFENRSGEQAALIQRRFEPWSKDWKISPIMVSETQTRRGDEMDELAQVYRKDVDPTDNLFATTFISLNYECYSDSIIFKTEAVIDYRFTYSNYRGEIEFKHLENFMHITKTHANNFQVKLTKEYGREFRCPNRIELNEALKHANYLLQKELKQYKFKAHMHREEYRLKELTDEIQFWLKESFEQIEEE